MVYILSLFSSIALAGLTFLLATRDARSPIKKLAPDTQNKSQNDSASPQYVGDGIPAGNFYSRPKEYSENANFSSTGEAELSLDRKLASSVKQSEYPVRSIFAYKSLKAANSSAYEDVSKPTRPKQSKVS